MELFDIIKNIFSQDPKKWSQISKNDKSRNFFMINRIMAIQFPHIANQFNKIKINPDATVDWWRKNLSSRYAKTPTWIYTKTIKKENKIKKDASASWETVELFVRDRYNVSKRDLSDLKRFYPMKYDLWMKDISDQIGIKNNS
jgi:hypothetical protein